MIIAHEHPPIKGHRESKMCQEHVDDRNHVDITDMEKVRFECGLQQQSISVSSYLSKYELNSLCKRHKKASTMYSRKDLRVEHSRNGKFS